MSARLQDAGSPSIVPSARNSGTIAMRYYSLIAALGLFGLVSCNGDSAPNDPEVPTKGDSATADDAEPQSDSQPQAPDGSKPSDAATVAAPPKLLDTNDVTAGWISLFDGQSLFGWKANDNPDAGGVNWRIEDGVIVADESEKPGLLLTSVRFSDYELQVDYRLESGGNSGVFLRSVPTPENPAVDCYELNMCNTHPEFPTGSIVGRKKVVLDDAGGDETAPEGKWHRFHVRVEGNQIVVTLDGRIILDFIDDSENQREIGFIGLQQNEGKIEFSNVALRPLGTMPLNDGKTLAGWREVPESKSEFKPDEDTIQLTGGPGFLETEKTWADFVLQFEVHPNAKNINSGVFFRAAKGTAENPSNGYELQICNSFANGNRAQPNDYKGGFGTGGIMHRAPARYIVADDMQWATMTLVADGPRFSTWVNGYPTAHWIDDRKPNDNPRKGQRLKAGHLSLQGHDDESDVDFRSLRILPVNGDTASDDSPTDE
jgi:hypothetical protein